MSFRTEHLYLSPGHNFFGHHGRAPSAHDMIEAEELTCLAGRGIAGDRFCDCREDYAGQITFFSGEVFAAMGAALRLGAVGPAGLRRNVVVRGLDLAALTESEFCLQGVWFRGAGECKPCYWMDTVFAPGTEAWLRGRGGVRARILTDGVLRAGPRAEISAAAEPALASPGA